MYTVIGNYLSPFVRMVLATLEHKQLGYRVDPLTPFFGNDEFSEISPLRKIPVLLDKENDLVLGETSVIMEYLEEQHPSPALLPVSKTDRARARFLVSYACSHLADVFIWGYFYQLVVRRFIWGEKPDKDIVQRSVEHDIPAAFDYLESIAPGEGFYLGEQPCAGDIAVAAFYRNLQYARYEPEAGRWQLAIRWINNVFDLPAFKKLQPFELVSATTPVAEQPVALEKAGAPLSSHSVIAETPRRGFSQHTR